jgi:hypothetical protein
MANLWLPILLTIAAEPASATTLTGAVRDGAGQPIAGADVFISTAAPRKGIGVL